MIDCSHDLVLLLPVIGGMIGVVIGIGSKHDKLIILISVIIIMVSLIQLLVIDTCPSSRDADEKQELTNISSMSCDQIQQYNHKSLNPDFKDYPSVIKLALKKQQVDCLK